MCRIYATLTGVDYSDSNVMSDEIIRQFLIISVKENQWHKYMKNISSNMVYTENDFNKIIIKHMLLIQNKK